LHFYEARVAPITVFPKEQCKIENNMDLKNQVVPTDGVKLLVQFLGHSSSEGGRPKTALDDLDGFGPIS
jgi:hypothetical protein